MPNNNGESGRAHSAGMFEHCKNSSRGTKKAEAINDNVANFFLFVTEQRETSKGHWSLAVITFDGHVGYSRL